MWYVTRFLSRPSSSRHFALAFFGVLAIAVPSLTTFAALVTTDLFIVTQEDPIDEDVYVTSVSGNVEGVIDGDLTIFTGGLTISGRVTGTVTVFSSGSVVVEPSGRIDGSLRGTAADVTVRGDVRDDLFVTAVSVVVEENGSVGRDALVFGGVGRIEGTVGRDVRGRSMRLIVDGTVGGDLDVATQKLRIGPSATVGGDVLYRSPVDADLPPEASIRGTVTRLPTQSNFIYGVILAMANIIGFLGFAVAGLVLLWAMPGSGSRAVGAVLTRPVRSLLVGLLTVLALPVTIVILAVTLVGLPLAILLVFVGIALFIVGPIPAVTALGNRILFRRGGLFGAFLVGAVLWRLGIWLIPVVGGLVYLLGLVWGVGAWVLGALAARRSEPMPVALLPKSLIAQPQIPLDWEPPLAPGFGAQRDDQIEGDSEDEALDADPEFEHGSAAKFDEPMPDLEGDEGTILGGEPSRDLPGGSGAAERDGADGEDDPPPSPDSWGLPSR
ncbi:MAG: hypothetical protein BMS9Abin20_0712 [Acidimicrobiia bacterium]|nr:MAG: hypothetical protein BMS9Abin20_0712 [Acidimicrobiia bacterium]